MFNLKKNQQTEVVRRALVWSFDRAGRRQLDLFRNQEFHQTIPSGKQYDLHQIDS